MSWDATLHDDRGHLEHTQNYTHNTNAMIAEAILASEDVETPTTSTLSEDHPLAIAIGPAWMERLHGMSGEEGVKFLQMIITEFEANPAKYRAMNPENGWGDYDSLLIVLKRMRDTTPTDWPTKWSVFG